MLLKLIAQMMNPNSEQKPELMEYDCVYQLKQIAKRYYQKKGQLTERLFKKLDAIVVERPRCLEKKKEYFFDGKLPTIIPSL